MRHASQLCRRKFQSLYKNKLWFDRLLKFKNLKLKLDTQVIGRTINRLRLSKNICFSFLNFFTSFASAGLFVIATSYEKEEGLNRLRIAVFYFLMVFHKIVSPNITTSVRQTDLTIPMPVNAEASQLKHI